MKIKLTIICTLVLITSLTKICMAEIGELEPVPSGLTYHTPRYHTLIRKHLLNKLPSNSRQNKLIFLSMPSFTPEIAISIYENGGKYFVRMVKPNIQIWSVSKPKETTEEINLESQIKEKQIDKNIALRIEKLWETMLMNTRYQKPEYMVLDGISYIFIKWVEGVGEMQGEAANPEEGTKPYILAKIGELLIDFVEKEDIRHIKKTLDSKIRALEELIKE